MIKLHKLTSPRRYADNLVKGFSTSAAVLLAAIASSFCFSFRPTPPFGVGVAVVVCSFYLCACAQACMTISLLLLFLSVRSRPDLHDHLIIACMPTRYFGSHNAVLKASEAEETKPLVAQAISARSRRISPANIPSSAPSYHAHPIMIESLSNDDLIRTMPVMTRRRRRRTAAAAATWRMGTLRARCYGAETLRFGPAGAVVGTAGGAGGRTAVQCNSAVG